MWGGKGTIIDHSYSSLSSTHTSHMTQVQQERNIIDSPSDRQMLTRLKHWSTLLVNLTFRPFSPSLTWFKTAKNDVKTTCDPVTGWHADPRRISSIVIDKHNAPCTGPSYATKLMQSLLIFWANILGNRSSFTTARVINTGSGNKQHSHFFHKHWP